VASDDYLRLAASALAIVAPGGTLLACTNQRGVSRARFRRTLFEAARAAGREVTQMKDGAPGPDHPSPPGGEERAKSAWVTCS
jgi:23S rRNA (cytosine1962-C5)-methyltransferase